jgi:hypothetical protein
MTTTPRTATDAVIARITKAVEAEMAELGYPDGMTVGGNYSPWIIDIANRLEEQTGRKDIRNLLCLVGIVADRCCDIDFEEELRRGEAVELRYQ